MKPVNLKNKNIILIIIIVLVIAASAIGLLIIKNTQGNSVVITQEGKTIFEGSLNHDDTINVYEGDEIINVITIKDGYAYMSLSTCPHHLCENMGKINSSSQSIVCLPHKVVVNIYGDQNFTYDSISN